MATTELFAEANRQLTICNACRYCEGLCPVFPAMEIRTVFTPDDVRYLANLCHDCRACEQACMFVQPHEFGITFPKIMSEARMESYDHLSWPRLLASSFVDTWKGLFLGLAVAIVIVATALIMVPHQTLMTQHTESSSFYAVVPYLAMVIPALALVLFGAVIWLQGGRRFWIAGKGSLLHQAPKGFGPVFQAIRDSFTVKYLGGGGAGCAYPGRTKTQWRRIYHSLVFWGFLSDLVSTTLAYIYQDFLHIMPPYSLTSLPVIFGAVGGVSLCIGVTGLLIFKARSDRNQAAEHAYSLDYAFLFFLGVAALSGLCTLAFRSTSAMGTLLIVHLALVAGLFITAPYGKFVHFVYRLLALVKFQLEAQGAKPQGGH